ncbi:MAG: hypothetical protein M3N45_12410 [Actinomycetota bacterium]|nr:hypothetical protein [Actinomycetota bacterium]
MRTWKGYVLATGYPQSSVAGCAGQGGRLKCDQGHIGEVLSDDCGRAIVPARHHYDLNGHRNILLDYGTDNLLDTVLIVLCDDDCRQHGGVEIDRRRIFYLAGH